MRVHQYVAFTHNIHRVCTNALISPNNLALFNHPTSPQRAHTNVQHGTQYRMDCDVRWSYCQDILLMNTATHMSVTWYLVGIFMHYSYINIALYKYFRNYNFKHNFTKI
jgi:hypothetical protein